jgi:hypothetical protein
MEWSSAMQRRRFKQMVSLEERRAEEATRLREKPNRFHPALLGSKRSERLGKLKPARTLANG